MLERKIMLPEYNGQTAAVGDRVFNADNVEGEVVYVGERQFVVDLEQHLWVYAKSSSGRLWWMENYIIVNGFLVPAPAPAEQFTDDLVYIADPGHVEFNYVYPIDPTSTRKTKRLFARGLIHRTAANAIAHAKAMLGIDPYARDSLDDAWDERITPPAGEDLPEPGRDAATPTPPEASSL